MGGITLNCKCVIASYALVIGSHALGEFERCFLKGRLKQVSLGTRCFNLPSKKASVSFRYEPLWMFLRRGLLVQIALWVKKRRDNRGRADRFCASFLSCAVPFQQGPWEEKGRLYEGEL